MAMLGKAPHRLVPHTIAKANRASAESLASGLLGGAGGGGPSFSLPWATGQTWLLWQGPHNTNGRAAGNRGRRSISREGMAWCAPQADGIVYRPCANYVIVDHGGGWETGYYYLPSSSIRVHEGQVVHPGDVLGHIGTAVGCGGYANGAHVHFSIYHFANTGGIHTRPTGALSRPRVTPRPPAIAPNGPSASVRRWAV